MNNKNVIIILLLGISLNVFGQDPIFHSGPAYDVRVLVVPFDPRIYLNDATAITAKETGETHDEIMHFYRREFNRMLNVSLMDSCIIVDLLSDDTRQARQDISDLYSGIGYQMKPKMQNRPEHPDDEPKQGFFQKITAKRQEKQIAERENTKLHQGEIVSKRASNENHYVHIHFTNKEVLSEISRRRGIDLFLFINQFEIKGVYETYMSGNQDLTRNFRVHFSMYDSMGNLTHGSYGITEIPFNLTDKQKVVDRYFPEVIRQIIHNIDFSY